MAKKQPSTSGAHELLLKSEGFLTPSKPLTNNNAGRSSFFSWLRGCTSTGASENVSLPLLSMAKPPVPPSSTPKAAVPVEFQPAKPIAVPWPSDSDEDDHARLSEAWCRHERKRVLSSAAARLAADEREGCEAEEELQFASSNSVRDTNGGIGVEELALEPAIGEIEVQIIRKDPSSAPPELFEQILSNLDPLSLINAQMVSRKWYASASSNQVWEGAFHAVFHNPRRAGLKKSDGPEDWRHKWQVKTKLEKRWKNAYAGAIYLEGHKGGVYCVQFDEDKILTGSRDETVRIWSARTYSCIKILGVEKEGAIFPAHSYLSDLLRVSDSNGDKPFIRITTPTSSVPPNTTPDNIHHTGSITCLQYDDKILVTGSSDQTLIIWDVQADYATKRQLRGHTDGVLDVCFDSSHIVSCSRDGTICLWDRGTGQFLRTLTGHRGPVNAVQIRGDRIVSVGGDGLAKLWNVSSGLCIKEFSSKDRGMACVEFSEDSSTILAGGNDRVIYQYDTRTGELIRELRGHENLVRSLYFDDSNRRLISGSYDGSVIVYDIETGELVANFAKWASRYIHSAKSDHRRIVATSQDSRAIIIDFGYQLEGIEVLEA